MKKNLSYAVAFSLMLLSHMAIAQLPEEIDLNGKWSLSWEDEFDYPDSQLDDNWISQNGASGGVVLCSRWRENAVVNNGIVELQAKKETRGGQDWTAASIWTKEKFHYGYYECRYKYAGATGTNNSFWMWTGYDIEEGQKAVELDPNEGHYPNEINTNIHNWTDKYEDGSHDDWPEHFDMGGIEKHPSYTHVLDATITTNKIRFSSTHGAHFHIGEFRIYAPNANGYPQDAVSNSADSEVAGLVNYTRDAATTITASGSYVIDGRNTDPENVANGLNTGINASWISQKDGEKWLEITLSEEKEIGCIQFTNGWLSGTGWNALIDNYKIEYYDGANWIELAKFDIADGADFSEEYHVVGMLWDETTIKYYFDGELIRTFPHDFIHAPTRVYLSLAILDMGIAGAVTDAIDGTSMKVDYVRYYTKSKDTSINNVMKNKLKSFPNPVNDLLFVENDNKLEQVSIYDLQGKMVLQSNLDSQNSINVSSLSPGVYCLVVNGVNMVETGKFIKN
ncbi:T9SS type A sorting domain-containing protein [Labilibacter marinus]|uniref:T9SS type A sorting domain-containing protein n=1 Tax=Labilibacter marinus TaxID=1477105 RepID=UPI00094FA2C6|nr:family 16 glycosylhydrolase [Labilibacter marinus]